MKKDTQHLEFLISQYVDGTLDPSSRKTLEQEMLSDPMARELHKQQRETQDILDDLGSRIPLINWNEFEAKLADRLEHEVPGDRIEISGWRRWTRPMAIAASLLIAAGVGYSWHAMQSGGSTGGGTGGGMAAVKPSMSVQIDDFPTSKVASSRRIDVDAPMTDVQSFAKVAVVAPGNAAAGGMAEGSEIFPHWAELNMRPGAVAASATARQEMGDRELFSAQ